MFNRYLLRVLLILPHIVMPVLKFSCYSIEWGKIFEALRELYLFFMHYFRDQLCTEMKGLEMLIMWSSSSTGTRQMV